MLAKRLGCHKVMALINRPAYAELMESGTIDVALSPQQVTIGSLLAHVRRGDVVRVHSLRRGAAEAIEAVAHGTQGEGRVIGRRIEDIPLPEGTTIGAIVRGDEVIIAHHDTMIQRDDHVILFLTDRRHVEAVERLFDVPRRARAGDDAAAHEPHSVVQRILGLLLMLFSLTMLPPIGSVALFPRRQLAAVLWMRSCALLVLGAIVWWPVRTEVRELRLRDGFLVVALFWVVLGVAGAVPLLLSQKLEHVAHGRDLRSGLGLHDHRRDHLSGARSRCRIRCCTTAARSNGSAASVSSCSRSRCCRCWASAACSCCARKRPGR